MKKRKIEQFKARGIPYLFASILVNISMIKFVREIILKTGIIKGIKAIMKV